MTLGKLWGVLIVLIGLLLAVVLVLAMPWPVSPDLEHGVSFSAPHATSIGLDWREAYDALLNDLQVRRFRLAAYWTEVEPREGDYDFTGLDYQMDRAAAEGAKVVLGVGRKLPRWPECHVPQWAQGLSEAEQQEKVKSVLKQVVKRYREHPALEMWQLENEPLLDFGNCPPEDRDFLRAEEELLRTLDAAHPILITDSGELNSWIPAAGFGDALGTTMYRTVFSGRTMRPFSYDYIFPAWLYRAKGRLVWLIYGKSVLISELQGEPWASRSFHEVTREERRLSLTPARLLGLRDFAARTQFKRVYWWGAEYWYWEKTIGNDPSFWETARTFFAQ